MCPWRPRQHLLAAGTHSFEFSVDILVVRFARALCPPDRKSVLEIFFFALNIAVSESRDRLRRGDRMSRRRSAVSSSIEFVEVPSSGALARFGSHLLGEQALRLLIAFSCFLRGLNRRLACFSHQCARGAADVDRVRRRRRAGG